MVELRLTVISGQDSGASFSARSPRTLIGRADTADIRLTDESVSWEHATAEEDQKRWSLKNLAAAGTTVNGTKVSSTVRLRHNDRIGLSTTCVLQVELLRPDGRPVTANQKLVPLTVALVIIVAAAVFLLQPEEEPWQGSTLADFRRTYATLHQQLVDWETIGAVPPASAASFAEAWRLDQGGSPAKAAQYYAALWGRLRCTPAEINGAVSGRFLTETYSGTSTNLLALVEAQKTGRVEQLDESQRVDALLRFIVNRIESTSTVGGES